MTLQDIEKVWRDNSVAEDVIFEGRTDPLPLRRSKLFPKVLSHLLFGGYKDFDGVWVPNDRVVWLAMIVSDEAQQAKPWLKNLRITLARNGFSLAGAVVPVKPKNWDVTRPFKKENELIYWYLRQDFRVIQNKRQTLVIHPGLTTSLNVAFTVA